MAKRPYIMAHDPGLGGAFAVIDPIMCQIVSLWDMPTYEEINSKGSKKKKVDLGQLAIQINAVIHDCEFCVIEDVHSMPHDGVASAFKFGQVSGISIGMISANLCGIKFVSPMAWKSVMNLGRDKELSRVEATKRYPFSAHLWNRTKDHGRAEAVLLADFGKRFY